MAVTFVGDSGYSIHILWKHKTIERIVDGLRREPEPEVFGPEEAGVEWVGDEKEDPAHEGK